MYVEADFRIARTPSEGDLPPTDQWLVQHRTYMDCALTIRELPGADAPQDGHLSL